ncbi:DUF262 domain-containing protein [Mycoplasmopsis hyopharyngis]|uniref:DUF262 domain-containing protein n=1 Tax=Mycoplasmopsis hyopharyngis TaxID=29558 RepID=UPI003872CAAD
MSEKIKKTFENKNIKYWVIRHLTFIQIKKQILNWMKDLKIIENIKKIKIIRKLDQVKNKVNLKFNLFDKTVYTKENYKEEEELSTELTDTFLKILEFLDILKIENKNNKKNKKEDEQEYLFSDPFVSFMTTNRLKENDVEKQLDEFLSKTLNDELMNTLKEKIEKLKEIQINVKKEKKIDFIFSIWLDGLNSYVKENKNNEEKIRIFDELLDEFKNICDIKKEKCYEELGKLLNEKTIIDIAEIFHKSFGISSKESERILLCDKNKKFEEYNDEELKKYKCKKLEEGEGSQLASVFEFFNSFKEGINIPIFQRAYVWNDEAIQMMIKSIISDMDKGKQTYLNNVIIMYHDHDHSRNLIDGQQRLFTIHLILYSIMKIMLYSPENDPIPKIFETLFSKDLSSIKNCNEIESCDNFNKVIVNPKNSNKNPFRNRILKIIKYIKNNVKDIRKFNEHILMKTIFTLTILNGGEEYSNKIFENLNTIQKTLSSLDLIRNYIYSQAKIEMSKNDIDSKEVTRIIEYFNKKIFEKFVKQNKNNEIDNTLLILFVDNLITKLNILDNSDHINQEVLIANKLKNILSFLGDEVEKDESLKEKIKKFKEKNKDLDSLLELKIFKALVVLHNFLNIFLYIKNSTKEEDIWNKTNIYISDIFAYSQAIKAAQWGDKTVVIPLVWAICDKFKIFDLNKENIKENKKQISDSIKWLFEIERFNVFWEEISYHSDSLGIRFFEIAKKIRDDVNYNLETFAKNLTEQLTTLNALSKEKRNGDLKDTLTKKYQENPLPKYNSRIKLYLKRINFYLNNSCSMFFNFKYANSGIYEYKIFDPDFKLDLEHNSPQKRNKESKITFDITEEKFDDEYKKYVSKIGNLSLLPPRDNIEQGNKDQSEKETQNCPEHFKITKGYGEKKDDNNNKYNDDKKDKIEDKIELWPLQINDNNWQNIKNHIDERSRQLINIILRMYSYKEEKDEESTN